MAKRRGGEKETFIMECNSGFVDTFPYGHYVWFMKEKSGKEGKSKDREKKRK